MDIHVPFRLLGTLALVAAVSAVIALLDSRVPARSLVVLYMPAVLAVAGLWGLSWAVVASIASVLSFDFFFLPATHRLQLDPGDVAGLLILVGCTLVMSELSSRARERAHASERARETIANEQAALRRVATHVARELPTQEVFDAVCAEVGALMEAAIAYLLRWERDGTATVVSVWHAGDAGFPVGARFSLDGQNVSNLVHQTGRPAHIEDLTEASGPMADELRALGMRASAGAPIVVGGRSWGAIAVGAAESRVLGEERLADFTELVSTAISNSEARMELEASRVRIAAAADAERRRIERNLHDGAQQRLVTLALQVRSAEMSLHPEDDATRSRLDHVARELGVVLDELREISRGIHPALLSDRGLKAAVRSLARRSPVAVELAMEGDERLPEPVEVAAYYVVSEALVNTAKHSGASVANVTISRSGSWLNLVVRDDGAGGADPALGTGLVGLADRVGALGGRFFLESPPGGGTVLSADLPIRPEGVVPGRGEFPLAASNQ